MRTVASFLSVAALVGVTSAFVVPAPATQQVCNTRVFFFCGCVATMHAVLPALYRNHGATLLLVRECLALSLLPGTALMKSRPNSCLPPLLPCLAVA